MSFSLDVARVGVEDFFFPFLSLDLLAYYHALRRGDAFLSLDLLACAPHRRVDALTVTLVVCTSDFEKNYGDQLVVVRSSSDFSKSDENKSLAGCSSLDF